jgi:signal transduction histidine kinase/CheY-like chemotaxis protein
MSDSAGRIAPGHRPTKPEGVARAIYAEQVDTVFRQMPIALAVNFVNATLTAVVLTPLAARPLPLPWFAAVMLITMGRGVLWLQYHRAPDRMQDAQSWSRLATCASLLAGLSWGIGGVVMFPVLPALGKIFITTVIGGMCAGAVVISPSHLPTLLAFLFSASLPMAGRFFAETSPSDSALGAMALVFTAALTAAGWHFNKIFAQAMRLRFQLKEANLRLQAEMAEHRATEAALHQAQKLEAVGHLTGGIAHDFNNLLSVVVGNAMLLRDRAPDEATKRRAAAILNIAERGERLTRQLLAFSRRRMLRPESLLLQERSDEISELLSRSLREDIGVSIDLPEDLWPVAVDPGEFELALLNIGVNARDAMPKGGSFRLEAQNRRLSGRAPSGGLAGDFVTIVLSDTGVGMPAEVVAHAFEPYYTTKNAGLGSGLGLSQVYGFASQSGGAAVIASEPGKGTAVTLYLPRARAASTVSGTVAASAADSLVAGHILLVEDDEEVAETTAELLRDMGSQTQRARSGKEALALIESGVPIDLVLSDVVMPGGVSGLDLARMLRERHPELPVVLATGYSECASQVASESFALVEKPYRRDLLAASLRSALEHRPRSA